MLHDPLFRSITAVRCDAPIRPDSARERHLPAVGDTVPPGAASDSDGSSSLSQTVARPIRYISVLIDGRRAVWNWPVDDVHGRAVPSFDPQLDSTDVERVEVLQPPNAHRLYGT